MVQCQHPRSTLHEVCTHLLCRVSLITCFCCGQGKCGQITQNDGVDNASIKTPLKAMHSVLLLRCFKSWNKTKKKILPHWKAKNGMRGNNNSFHREKKGTTTLYMKTAWRWDEKACCNYLQAGHQPRPWPNFSIPVLKWQQRAMHKSGPTYMSECIMVK